MLTQSNFVSMLTDLQVQMVTTVKTIQTLTNEIEDKELRYQFVAMAQSKQRHLEAMNALASLVEGGVPSLTAVAAK